MTLIKLTHANHGQTIYVPTHLIAGWYFSPGHKCTHVVAAGGAIFPAKETCEEVESLYNKGKTPEGVISNGVSGS